MSGVRISHLGPECVDERCSTENTAQKRGVFTYLSVFSLQKVRKWDFSTSRSPRACSPRWGWTLERKRRSNMAVRRLKGLYLKSEGKYLEDYPSCYVEQTEALFEWRQSTPKQDIELHKRAEKFSGLFRDMLLGKDAIEDVKLFEDAAFFSPTAFTSAQ